jgi:hypothetical protein
MSSSCILKFTPPGYRIVRWVATSFAPGLLLGEEKSLAGSRCPSGRKARIELDLRPETGGSGISIAIAIGTAIEVAVTFAVRVAVRAAVRAEAAIPS